MNCLFVQRNMPEFLENQLAPAQMKRLQAHLNKCAACRADWEHFHAPHRALKKRTQISASYQLQLRLKKMVETESPPARQSRWYQYRWLRLIYGLALLALFWWARKALITFPVAHPELLALAALFLVVLCTALLVLLSTNPKIELKEKSK